MTSVLNLFKISEKIPKNIEISIKSFCVFNDYFKEYRNIIFITKEDKVYGLGNNSYGVLGFGHNNEVEECTEIKELSNQKISDLVFGANFVLGKNEENLLFGWGRNDGGQLARSNKNRMDEYLKPEKIEFFKNKKIEDICCGFGHTLVLLSNGLLYGWGYNSEGQLDSLMKKVIKKPTNLVINANQEFKYIYCSENSSFAITTNGELFSWGNNECGILGQGVNEELLIPKIELSNVRRICLNGFNSYFLTKEGFVYFCGKYEDNGKEFKQNKPKKINELNEITDLYFVCYDREVICGKYDNSFHSLIRNKSEKVEEKYESVFELFAKRFQITPQMIHISSDGKIDD